MTADAGKTLLTFSFRSSPTLPSLLPYEEVGAGELYKKVCCFPSGGFSTFTCLAIPLRSKKEKKKNTSFPRNCIQGKGNPYSIS